MSFSLCVSEVTQSCLTLCDPVNSSLPGPSVHGILQARILEWVAISFSRGSSQPRHWTLGSCIADRFFTIWATRKAPFSSVQSLSCVQLFMTSWVAGRQASLSINNSQSLLKFMSIESVMPFSYLILCHPLLLLKKIDLIFYETGSHGMVGPGDAVWYVIFWNKSL